LKGNGDIKMTKIWKNFALGMVLFLTYGASNVDGMPSNYAPDDPANQCNNVSYEKDPVDYIDGEEENFRENVRRNDENHDNDLTADHTNSGPEWVPNVGYVVEIQPGVYAHSLDGENWFILG
jgi:hypothetical protein